jgi:hypothetical protein
MFRLGFIEIVYLQFAMLTYFNQKKNKQNEKLLTQLVVNS